jgi:N-acyl-D-amino-acid deacylase
MRSLRLFAHISAACLIISQASSAAAQTYDLVLRGGLIYDGSGAAPYVADVAIGGERIVAIGQLDASQSRVLDVKGLAVAPGFINMLSWATRSLLVDGASQSDVRQGVTLEVFGEGSSPGPLNDDMRQAALKRQTDLRFDIPWTTLGEYLEHLVAKGVAPNVASFVGATTVRVHELGYADREPTAAELKRMQALVAQAMREGALGVGSSLIYAPAFYARTSELVALMQTAARYNGMYISHMRGEGNRLLESIDELIQIAEQSESPAEIYHLKISGKENWHKYDDAVAKIDSARRRGLSITANMYTYTAGSTGLDAAMPPWVQEGGYEAWAQRLADPEIRARVAAAMISPPDDWENLLLSAGADKTLLVGFRNPELRRYAGMTLADVAQQRGSTPEQTAIDLVIEDGSRVQVVYFLMSEENVAKTVALPWVSFGSDAAADNLKLRRRGQLKAGYFADIAVFDPAEVRDHATYADPHRYSTGMVHVFVNGQQVLEHTEHTGKLPGQVVRGPGWVGWKNDPDVKEKSH